MKELMVKLSAIGAIKFGRFEVRKGFYLPFQIDLGSVISHPSLAKEICGVFWEKARYLDHSLIAAIPTVASSCLTTYLAWHHDLPLIGIGPKGKMEGMYKSGTRCLLIQDVYLVEKELLDAIDLVEEGGVKVRDILTLIDAEVEGKKTVKSRGYVLHSLFSMQEIIPLLLEEHKVSGSACKIAQDFLEQHGKGKRG